MMGKKAMRNVCRKIDTKTNGNHQRVTGYDINCQTPEMHEAGNFNDGSSNTKYDDACAPQTAKKYEDGEENSNQGGNHVLIELTANHLICFPVRIP